MKGLMLALFMVTTLFMAGCSDIKTGGPFQPTDVFPGSSNPPGEDESLFDWSPYVVVFTPGEALQAYQKAIPELMAAGAVKGVRIDLEKGDGKGDGSNPVIKFLVSKNLDILWIFDNYFLFEPNIELALDQTIQNIERQYVTRIRYLQIGNETTTILPKPGPQITIEEYMTAFKRIYTYVQTRYPSVILVTQSTFGSGNYGSNELETMVKLGLKEMSPSKLVIGMNVYSVATAYNNSHVVNGLLRGYRVWVTESGIPKPDDHIRYVRDTYPVLKNSLRAERIYWYVLYEESGHKLMDINGPNFWTSPLYNLLAGRK